MARILLLDDEEPLRRMMAKTLTDEGHEISEYSDGRIVRDAEVIAGIDLLITDMVMPEVDGLEAVLAVKRVKPSIKVIAISGGGRTVTIDYLPYAKSFGALAVLHKPFSIAELLAEVRTALAPSGEALKSA